MDSVEKLIARADTAINGYLENGNRFCAYAMIESRHT